MWPISDTSGDIVGFGARKLRDDDNGPKYLNTPETSIYKKSQVLYGIDLAKKDIAKASRAVVVEGYTDVMACHLAGVTTAIATCGTAFGNDHIKILRRLLMDNGSARVIFTFDGDAAGQKAALRAFEDDQKFAAETYIAIAPDNMDPCDLRLAKGDDAVRDRVEPRTPLFEFALRQIVARYDLETPAGRAAALDEAAAVVAKIKTSSVQRRWPSSSPASSASSTRSSSSTGSTSSPSGPAAGASADPRRASPPGAVPRSTGSRHPRRRPARR